MIDFHSVHKFVSCKCSNNVDDRETCERIGVKDFDIIIKIKEDRS